MIGKEVNDWKNKSEGREEKERSTETQVTGPSSFAGTAKRNAGMNRGRFRFSLLEVNE